MPFKINYIPEKSFIEIIVSGAFPLSETQASFDAIYESPDLPINLNQLWDMREFDIREAEYENIEKVISLRGQYTGWNSYRKATIVKDELAQGAFKLMYDAMNARFGLKVETRVFTNYDEGKKWLLGE